MVRSCLLLSELEDDELPRQLVERLFNAAHIDHPVRVEKHMLMILQTCVEDGDNVSQQLVDAVLENLLEPKKSERPASYKLARTFLRSCAHEMQRALHGFLQGCLPTSSGPSQSDESELKDEWQNILLELCEVSPDTVTYLLPQLEGVVTMEDEQIRLNGTRLLGALFLLPECHVAQQVPSLFSSAFLGRIKDISWQVRIAAVEQAVELIVKKPDLAPQLISALTTRVLDNHEKVREVVIRAWPRPLRST